MDGSSLDAGPPGKDWANFASSPTRDKLKEMLVRPWSGIIYNIQYSSETALENGPGGFEILDFFRVFNPVNVQIKIWNGVHLGAAIIQFKDELEGLQDALAFENYFSKRKHVRENWIANQEKGVGSSLYGWLARGEDYQASQFSKYLQATGELVRFPSLVQEMAKENDQTLVILSKMNDEEVANLSQQLDKLQQQLEDRNSDIAKFQSELAVVKGKLEVTHAKYQEQETAAKTFEEQLRQRNLQLEAELAVVKSELEVTNVKCIQGESAAEAIVEQLRQRNLLLEAELAVVKSELEITNVKCLQGESAAEAIIEQLRQRNIQLESKVVMVKDELQVTSLKCDTAVTTFGKELQEKNSQLQISREEFKKSQSAVMSARTECQGFETAVDSLNGEVRQCKYKYERGYRKWHTSEAAARAERLGCNRRCHRFEAAARTAEAKLDECTRKCQRLKSATEGLQDLLSDRYGEKEKWMENAVALADLGEKSQKQLISRTLLEGKDPLTESGPLNGIKRSHDVDDHQANVRNPNSIISPAKKMCTRQDKSDIKMCTRQDKSDILLQRTVKVKV